MVNDILRCRVQEEGDKYETDFDDWYRRDHCVQADR